jgi:hypothetical protein
LTFLFAYCKNYQGSRDVESLKKIVLEEAEKAATKAQLGIDKEL